MQTQLKLRPAVTLLALSFQFSIAIAGAFEGRMSIALTRSGETQTLLYTVGTNQLRIDCGESERPYAKNILSLDTGALTLLFPHNRSYVRLKKNAGAHAPSSDPASVSFAGVGPGMHPNVPDQHLLRMPPQNIDGTNLPVMPPMPQIPSPPQLPPGGAPRASGTVGGRIPTLAMPMMPPMPMEQMQLKPTQDTTNLLGYVSTRYELKRRGEVMEIWATDKLLPFQPYLQNQPARFGPNTLEEQWGRLLQESKLFPLLAILRTENPSAEGSPPVAGLERLRFEVKSVTPEKIADEKLFQPPLDYHEVQPLPF